MYPQRVEKVRTLLRENNIDCLFLNPSTNLRYLTGYSASQDERLLLLVIPEESEPFFFAPRLYSALIDKTPVNEAIYWNDNEDPVLKLSQTLRNKKIKPERIGVEDSLAASFLLRLQKAITEAEFVLTGNLFSGLRLIKDAAELEILEKASSLTDEALARVLESNNWVGKSERDLATALEFELKKSGMEDLSFKPIVGAGPNGASPHHTTGDKTIAENEAVVIDFGGVYKGYCSDMTRTVFFGEPDAKFKEVYNTVKEAQELALRSIKPGMRAEEVDSIARKYIEEKGYGDYFIHRTGHGLGMNVHEEPYIVEGNKEILQPGMVFSVEPGIYLPKEFGVRIEDIVVVTEEGCQILNKFPKELSSNIISINS